MKQPVILIAALEGATAEAVALRSALEYFGAFVAVKWIGRPRDFMDVLNGKLPIAPDYVVISGHGDEDGFLMSKLGENVYEPDEPRGNFTPEEVKKHLMIKGVVPSTLLCDRRRRHVGRFSQSGMYLYCAVRLCGRQFRINVRPSIFL